MGGNTGMRDCFVAKGIEWYRGMWGGVRPNGTEVITIWNQVDGGRGTEMPWQPDQRRSALRARPDYPEGTESWQHQRKGRDYIERCARSLASGRPLEVILLDGDRQGTGEPKKVYVLDGYYAVRITYVGSKEAEDYGVVNGEFMTRAEYEAAHPQ